MTDRQLLLHMLQHAEDAYGQLTEIRETVAALKAELDTFAPLFERFRPRAAAPPGTAPRSVFDWRSRHG